MPNTHRNSSLQPSIPQRGGQGLSFRRATASSPLIKKKVKCRALSVLEVSRGTEVRASGLGSLAELQLERKLHSRRAHDYRCNRWFYLCKINGLKLPGQLSPAVARPGERQEEPSRSLICIRSGVLQLDSVHQYQYRICPNYLDLTVFSGPTSSFPWKLQNFSYNI